MAHAAPASPAAIRPTSPIAGSRWPRSYQVVCRAEPRSKARRQRVMRRGFLWLTGLIPLIASAGCGASGGIAQAGSPQGHTYRDRAGWVIKIPPGWHAVRFSDAKDGITSAGVQLSNVPLPPPVLVRGFPIQANGGVLPAR